LLLADERVQGALGLLLALQELPVKLCGFFLHPLQCSQGLLRQLQGLSNFG
jgi:hypothetical protein